MFRPKKAITKRQADTVIRTIQREGHEAGWQLLIKTLEERGLMDREPKLADAVWNDLIAAA